MILNKIQYKNIPKEVLNHQKYLRNSHIPETAKYNLYNTLPNIRTQTSFTPNILHTTYVNHASQHYTVKQTPHNTKGLFAGPRERLISLAVA